MSNDQARSRLGFYVLLFVVVWVAFHRVFNTSVTVHYSSEAIGELSYIWNVQHRIYKGRMMPGGGTYDSGHVFPDEEYFMELDWWQNGKGRNHCVSIVPGWSAVTIHLDAEGNIDTREESGTDMKRLKECTTDSARM